MKIEQHVDYQRIIRHDGWMVGMAIHYRYKLYSEQHARAGTNIQHVIYDQLARAGQNTQL